jgi:hypothetical protein
MLLQPKCASPSLSSWTNQSTAHKRENRPNETRAKKNTEGWFITLEGRILMPEKAALGLIRLAHNITHLGKTSYKDYYTNTWSFPDWQL